MESRYSENSSGVGENCNLLSFMRLFGFGIFESRYDKR